MNLPSNFQYFLESEIGRPNPHDCLFHVLPACYEKSVSYGKGTENGPLAIIEASQQLEVFDGVDNPSESGIFTLAPVFCREDDDPDVYLFEIAANMERLMRLNKIPVLLGGEHTVSVSAFRALLQIGKPIGIVQFDAHADLRDEYDGDPLSHACVMRRAAEAGFKIFQIGVRSMSPEEVTFRKEKNIPHLDAVQIAENGIPENMLPDDFPENIYITFDVDALDPSIMPATGTPEPGGLMWYPAINLLKKMIQGRNVMGFDVVELAPIDGFHAPDFAVARLVYNLMGIIARSR